MKFFKLNEISEEEYFKNISDYSSNCFQQYEVTENGTFIAVDETEEDSINIDLD